MNLAVKPGQRVAIVGPTGCGKTTLINLLMRFYDVDERRVSRSAGSDIRGRHAQEPAQQPTAWSCRIRGSRPAPSAKISPWASADATDEEMIAAAKATHAHSFIKRLPEGYDTVIAEDGGSLSQGQKQLLCITRVMLCLPPMLILDEATSSIDTRTEMHIQRGVCQADAAAAPASSWRTACPPFRTADVILVMNQGDVIEQGTHEELLARGGFYARLYRSQFEQ